MTPDEIKERCEQFAKQLGEHCDAVLVSCSIPDMDDNRSQGVFSTGSGDYNSRIALAHDFIAWDAAERLAFCLKKREE